MHEGDVIDACGQVGEQIADPLAGLAILVEFPLGTHDAALVAPTSPPEGLDWDGAAIERIKLRFVVESVDVAGAAIHEQEDDAFRLGSKVRITRSQGINEHV